jgi:hypothetical protein
MNAKLIAAAAAALGMASIASASVQIFDNVTATMGRTWSVAGATPGVATSTTQVPTPPTVIAPGAVYSNVTTFAGTGITATDNPSTSNFSYAIADDLTTTLGNTGKVTNFRFSIVNFNTAATAITPYVRFFDDDGASGGPGTLLGGFNFNAVNVNAGTATTLGFSPAVAQQFNIPTGKIWGVQFFSTASAAATQNVGVGVYNPPDVGTSNGLLEWDSNALATSSTSFTTANPSGFLYTQGYSNGTIPSNFGWEIVATVPEPTTLGALAGIGAIVARRRKA